MSEDETQGTEAAPAATTASATTTGHGAVDAVLASLQGLAELPVEEHVAVFEQAHEQLRGALDAPSGPRPPALPAAQG
jgi:hypothetical protein